MTTPLPLLTTLGLMTGTSTDGLDLALLRTDGQHHLEFGPTQAVPLPPELKTALLGLMHGQGDRAALEVAFTDFNAAAIQSFLAEHQLAPEALDGVGFHGQTLSHHPERGETDQLGDGPRLAHALGCPVVYRFRHNDLAHGGQGAPLAPLFHQALAHSLERPLAILNLGGVGNVTWLGPGNTLCAFDTGPANAPMDDLLRERTGQAYDAGGALAQQGTSDKKLVEQWMRHPYFQKPAPKSLDRNQFDVSAAAALPLPDALATLAQFVVESVAAAGRWFPQAPQRWLVTGGGRHNTALMHQLQQRLQVPVEPVEAVGWSGDFLEAQAFAYLAVRSQQGWPLSLPETTGVTKPVTGGECCLPHATSPKP